MASQHEASPHIGAYRAEPSERASWFWQLTAGERVAAMRRGELTLAECCRWASRAPHEIPLLNGEFEFIAAFTADATETPGGPR